MPFIVELLALAEFVELGREHCFDVFRIRCENDAFTGWIRLNVIGIGRVAVEHEVFMPKSQVVVTKEARDSIINHVHPFAPCQLLLGVWTRHQYIP